MAMRSDYPGGLTFKEIADRYGMSTTATYRAIRGITWAHLPGPVEASE